jgi:hypothetical protein
MILTLVFVGAVAWGGEPNEVPISLDFEVSSTPLGPFTPDAPSVPVFRWRAFGPYKPTYAAAIDLVEPTEFLPTPTRGGMSGFPEFAVDKAALSPRQKEFLQATRAITRNQDNILLDRSNPNGPRRVLLYALSLDDAKEMARAYFDFAANKTFRRTLADNREELRTLAARLAGDEKRFAEVEKTLDTAQKALDELVKTVPYRTQEEAHGAIGELDRMLNAAQVEIVGITAKIDAIQAYRQQRRDETGHVIERETGTRLDMMFVEESVALRGAEARKQMATRLREQANRFLDLTSTLAAATQDRKSLPTQVDRLRNGLTETQNYLERLRQEEPKIPDKVVIYPVQWQDVSAGN